MVTPTQTLLSKTKRICYASGCEFVIVVTPTTIVISGNSSNPKFQIPGTTVFNMEPPSSAATQVNYKPFSHLTR